MKVEGKKTNTKSKIKNNIKVSMPIYVVFAILLLVAIVITTIYAAAQTYVWSLVFFVPIFALQIIQLIISPKKDKIINFQILGIIFAVVSVALLIAGYIVIENQLYYKYIYYYGSTNLLIETYYSIINLLTILIVITAILIIVTSVLYLYKVFSVKPIKTYNKIVENNEFNTKQEIEQLKEMLNNNIITKEEHNKMLNQILDNEVRVAKSPTKQEEKIAKINELKHMKESGMLTEEEYKKLLTNFLVE